MNSEYALQVLKDRKESLKHFNLDDQAIERHGKESVERLKTRVKHQLGSIEFAIEVLETYMD